MARPSLRILSVLLVSAAAAWCAWRYLPSTAPDRMLARITAGTMANPPFIISGRGTHAAPWSLRVLAPHRTADPGSAPVVVSLGDDPEGIFQSSPPSPVDFAVILKNIRRLGGTRAAVSAVLAWENPDAISLAALDSELEPFESVVTAAPLSRGATSSAIPPSFRRASIPATRIRGDLSDIPSVNRISLPGVILGGDSALSGFTILENEPKGIPLLARWDDRIVFSFPLIAALARHGLSIEGVEVDPGNYIRLGPAGPYVPIDAYGRLTIASDKGAPPKSFAAAGLIDATAPLPVEDGNIVLLRDDQSSAESATRAFSGKAAELIAGISSGAGMSPEKSFRRLAPNIELPLLGAVCLLLAGYGNAHGRFGRAVIYGIVAGAALVVHFIGTGLFSLWMPTLPLLAAALAAFALTRLCFGKEAPLPAEPRRKPAPAPSPAAAPEKKSPPTKTDPSPAVSADPLPAPAPPAKQPAAKKAAAKKTSAKKSPAAKKAAAKKKSSASKKGARKKKSDS